MFVLDSRGGRRRYIGDPLAFSRGCVDGRAAEIVILGPSFIVMNDFLTILCVPMAAIVAIMNGG